MAIKYEVKPVVSDYGVYENDKLKLICEVKSNAELIVEIMKSDIENKPYKI